ncbi:hypothetical protein HOF67_01520 [Candidatus Peregrinibacteria bacterium]|nr:hypothetical protein [Candidatus Peregrinibacteria bacterium]
MARTAQINYQRVTFSFPAKTVKLLREKVGNQNMSKYVVGLIEDKLTLDADGIDRMFDELAEFRKKVKLRDKRDSVEILREIRYGKE